MSDRTHGYMATPARERELARTGTISLEGGRYRATVITSGLGHYEAYTDSLPFLYGRPAGSLQGALDNLEAAVLASELATEAVRPPARQIDVRPDGDG